MKCSLCPVKPNKSRLRAFKEEDCLGADATAAHGGASGARENVLAVNGVSC